MKHLHWELGHHVKNFDSADISTFAILGTAVALIVLMLTSLFFSTPTQSDLLMFSGP